MPENLLKPLDRIIWRYGLGAFALCCFIGAVYLWDANRLENAYWRGYDAAMRANGKAQPAACPAALADEAGHAASRPQNASPPQPPGDAAGR